MRQLVTFLLLGLFALAQEEKTIWDVWSDGSYAYLATGEGVRVLDGSLKEKDFLGGFPAYALAGDGKRLYVAGEYGLHVLSLGEKPRVEARLKDFSARAIAFWGNRVYLGGPAGFLLAEVSQGEPRTLAKLTGFSVWALVGEENRAFLATNQGFLVMDLSSPRDPQKVAEVALGASYALAVGQGVAYVGTSQGIVVLAEEEGKWREVARLAGPKPYRLLLYDDLLLSVGIGGLRAYSLDNPREPTLAFDQQALVYTSAFAQQDKLWITSPSGVFLHALALPGLPLVNSTEPAKAEVPKANPRFAQRYGAYSAVVSGKVAYLAARDGVKVLDLTNPHSPKLVAHVPGFLAYSVLLVGDFLYVGCADGLRVFSVKTLGRLEQKAYLREKPIYALLFSRGLLYLGTEEGIVEIEWKGSAFTLHGKRSVGPVYSIGEYQGYLYFGGSTGLWGLDPGQRIANTSLLLRQPVFSLAIYQNFFYIGDMAGLRIYQALNPKSFEYIGGLPGFPAYHLSIVGKRLYVLMEGGLYLLDVSEPASPKVVSNFFGVPWAYLFVFGDYAYVLGLEGIHLLKADGTGTPDLVLNYLAKIVPPAASPSLPPPPTPAKGWYGTHWVRTLRTQPWLFYQPPTYALTVAVDAKGFVYVGGVTEGALPRNTHMGGEDAFLAKFDPSGKLLWVRQFGTGEAEGVFALSLDRTGNVYVAGHTTGSLQGWNRGNWDLFVAKFDPNGKRVFLSQYGTDNWDKVTGLGIDGKGNLYLTGFTYGAFPGQKNAGDRDYFVAKLDFAGKLQWVRQGGSRGGDLALSLAVANDGFIYIVGVTDYAFSGQNSYGGEDLFVVKHDSAGKVVWRRQLGTDQDDRGQSIAVDSSGVYVGGTTKGSFLTNGLGTKAFLLRLDKGGNQLWVREFGAGVIEEEGSIAGSAYVALAPNGNVYLANSATGDLPGYLGAGGADTFVLEYTPQGKLVSVLQSGSGDDDLTYALAVGPKGEVYVVGSSNKGAFLMKAKTPLPAHAGP